MTETASTEQRLIEATGSAAAKFRAFHDGLTPAEREIVALAFRQTATGADDAADDTRGHLPAGGHNHAEYEASQAAIAWEAGANQRALAAAIESFQRLAWLVVRQG